MAGVAAGLLAFVLTWLAGHPLLIDAPALSFWLLLGGAVGWGSACALAEPPEPSVPAGSPLAPPATFTRWVVMVVVVALAVSVPLRTRQALRTADLEHLGIGLTGWQTVDGTQYRMAGMTSTVFVPAQASVVTLPLRSLKNDELDVELFLDGRHADTVRVPSAVWRIWTIQVPQDRDGPRFRTLELRVRGIQAGESRVLMVGKVQRR